jgi:hypothetical protein
VSTSEAVVHYPPAPGGGAETDGPICAAKADPGTFELPFTCRLPEGHAGQHEAGVQLGLMVASWTEDET